MIKFPRHKDGSQDMRYTCELEHSGKFKPQYVPRFCGEAISFRNTEESATAAMAEHQRKRMAWP